MGWEEINTSSTVCPCGKGKITQKHYGDDWNRYQDGPVIIECEICAKKYMVEEKTHHGLLNSDGSWSTYYLAPLDYPEYEGTCESKIYPQPINQYDDFSSWLIENYTEEKLIEILSQLHSVTTSRNLHGAAAKICLLHKKALGTVRVTEIIKTVEMALSRYPNYMGTKNQREKIRAQEAVERSNYMKEKQKHLIVIDLK